MFVQFGDATRLIPRKVSAMVMIATKKAKKTSSRKANRPPLGDTCWIWWPEDRNDLYSRCGWKQVPLFPESPVGAVAMKPARMGSRPLEIVKTWSVPECVHVRMTEQANQRAADGGDCGGDYCEYDTLGRRIYDGCTGQCSCPSSVEPSPFPTLIMCASGGEE
jgi:hypothetical protein